VRTEHPASTEIARLSPTSFEILRECRLRFGFGQQRSNGSFRGTPATRLGTVCHAVLDKAVRDGHLQSEGWRKLVEQLWEAELAVERERPVAAGVTDEPKKWPGYQLKRARLFQVAGRVREFLQELPPGAHVLPEEPLEAGNGLLYGRPDLIIRGPGRHQIIDYKSGGVLDRETNRPREAYVRQLQLYAYLEHAASGSWPTSAHLFPLHGAPVEIDVDPRLCSELAAQAFDAANVYNAAVPDTPRATPTLEHCRWCPHATVCASFWEACDESWAPWVVAAVGVVTQVFATPLGGITLTLNVEAGSVNEQKIVIKNIDPAVFEDARELNAGDEVAAAGLVADERGSGYWLAAAGLYAVTPLRGNSAGGTRNDDSRAGDGR
jgi:hypothetical protein